MSDVNVTTHISLNPNLTCLIQNFLHYMRCQTTLASQMQIEEKSTSNLSNGSSSMHSYVTYRKNIHNRLSQINKNISNTIIEGCRGIDNICYKVRQCLDESSNIGRSKSAYNELSWRRNDLREIKRKSEGSTEVSLIESVHDVSTEKSQTSDIIENIAPAAIPEISEEATKSLFDREIKVAKKLSLAKIKRQIKKRNLILEEFRETVMDQIEYDDFEAMGKIVENLNEDIDNFDKTVAETEEGLTDNKEMLKTEIEVLTTQTMDAQESMQILKSNDCKFENFEVADSEKKMPFIIPEVYPKPSVTDLHRKLIFQLEANDSYLCFQRLMDSHAKLNTPNIRQIISDIPSVSRTACNRIVDDCSSSVSFQRKARRRKKSHKKIRSDSQSAIGCSRKRDVGESEMKLANVRSDLYAKYADSLWFPERYLGKAKSSRSSVKSKRSTKDRHKKKPIPAALQKDKKHEKKHAPKQMSKCSSDGFHSDATICLSRCTTSGYSCNLKINNDLPVAPSTKCHLRWIRIKNEQAPSRKIEYLDILDDLTPKDLLPLQSEYPRRDRQGGVKFFNEFRPKPPTSKSIKETYLYRLLHEKDAKQANWNHLLRPSIECCNVECSVCHGHGASKCDENKRTSQKNSEFPDRATAAQKLLPYIQDPTTNLHFQSVTVMPVRVFYDHKNWQTNGRLATDKTDDQKPHPVAMKEAKAPSKAKWVPPDQGSSSKSLRAKTTNDNSVRQESSRSLIKKNSKLYSPKDRKQLEKYIRVQSDIEKKSIEIQEKTPSGLGGKLWANKYGKSVGHRLVSFVKNQPQESKPALPKYAMPNGSRDIKNTARHKQMLDHLRGLKEKNDEIQTNIQKAINVIEIKMIDILSAPGNSSSVEAFDLMEKEITNVLSLMKFNPKGNSKSSNPNTSQRSVPRKIDNLEEDFNSISDQLFQKLEKILDSDQSRATTSASDPDNKVEEVTKKKQKSTVPRKSSGSIGDRYQSSSLTSTSLEDTSYKKNDKNKLIKKSRTGRCPNPERVQVNEVELNKNATLEQIERDYATGENCGAPVTKSEIVAKQKHEEANNSRGDCIEDSCEKILASTSFNDIMNDRLGNATDLQEDGEKFERSGDDPDEKNHEQPTVELPVVLKLAEKEWRVEESESPSKSESDESDPGLSDQVNKIIKRVEDIYNHLDDIHISNDDQIPVFSEPSEVPGVASQQFLTPFMQAVKEKRSRPATPITKVMQRSPSYYNVLTFLDTLSAIQQEKPTEVHTARLCYYSQICLLPKVSYRAHIEHTVKTEKTGCLRKHSDEGKSKHKKVSFLVLKENKSCQASICSYHKFKVLKVSSQQFPSTEGTESPLETCHTGNAIQLMVQENDISVLCDKRQNTKVYRDHPEVINIESTKNVGHESDHSTQVYCQTRTGNLNPEKDDVQLLSESSANLITDKPPQVFYDKSDADIPKSVFNGSYSHHTILKVKNSALPEYRPKPKIVVLRKVSEVSGLLQPLKDMEKFGRASLNEENGRISSGQLTDINSETEYENVALLKSCYAFVYIIMFTAFNLNYRCA